MGFRIGYERLLTVQLWHPAYLGLAKDFPTRPARPNITDALVEKDLIAYDLREILELRPTPQTSRLLDRYGLRYRNSTTGGWVLGEDTNPLGDIALTLELGIYVRDPEFTEKTRLFRSGVPSAAILELTTDGLPNGNAGDIQLLSDGDFTGDYRDLTDDEQRAFGPGLFGLISIDTQGRRGHHFDILFQPQPSN